jgi:hypothetical protein
LKRIPGVTYKRCRFYGRIRIHDRSACSALKDNTEFCPFDKPSKHKMLDWPMNIRLDSFSAGLVERICPHGVGHPDPDSTPYMAKMTLQTKRTWGTHGCDGCCD